MRSLTKGRKIGRIRSFWIDLLTGTERNGWIEILSGYIRILIAIRRIKRTTSFLKRIRKESIGVVIIDTIIRGILRSKVRRILERRKIRNRVVASLVGSIITMKRRG